MGDQVEDLKREMRRKWSKLNKADLDGVDFDAGRLAHVVARRYSIPAEQAREQVDEFVEQSGATFREATQFLGEAARDLWRSGAAHVAGAVHSGSEKASELWTTGREQLSDLGKRANDTVRSRPWVSVGVAAGAGVLLGLLLRRRG